ncbi:hypothetical protein PVAND_005564 [Polypedilum vanderplanki]|uniref:cGMP-dependent protein kinase N-terminal coiled-coil domain-containing protein n=1 Tax=Polypedilum vanderplanki TaxID=319348 RepID=A0A9J6C0W2_POLVA|nr:hypothetical protein PVAND_005564 [Polypedilum vanderplanki]
MRLCFNGFCLGPQRPLAVEQSSQTTLTLGCVIDNFNVTTFFNKSEPLEESFERSKESSILKTSPSYKMISEDELGIFQPINDSNMQVMAENSDAQNNNHLNPTQMNVSQSDLLNTVDAVENICINDVNMETDQQLTSKEKDLIKIIQIKDVKIKELEVLLNQKDEEIANLKSHLDKFQSVFSRATAGGINRKTIGRTIQRQRAQGISAEPQSQSQSLHELLNVSFPKYDKNEK